MNKLFLILILIVTGCKTVDTKIVPINQIVKPIIACVEPEKKVKYIKCEDADKLYDCIAANSLVMQEHIDRWREYRDCVNNSVK